MTRNLNNVAWFLLLAVGLAVAAACSSSTTTSTDEDAATKEDTGKPASKS